MGLRGPKPVDLGRLRNEAEQWATLLYAVRNGQSGEIHGVKYKGRTISKLELMLLWAKRERSPQAEAAYQALLRTTKPEDWAISPPVEPAPKIWEQLKRARSVKEIQEVSRGIRRWASEYMPGGDWATRFPDALTSHADKVLSAKRLPNYPKTDRARSDDKRIEFFSKVLAGLMLGIAPITAAKRLSHWHLPKKTITDSKERGML